MATPTIHKKGDRSPDLALVAQLSLGTGVLSRRAR
jgi:hypothetical protein